MNETETESAPDTQFELVEDPVKIQKLLERLQAAHTLVSVKLPAFPGMFSSMILEIHPDRGWVSIDELNPQEGHRKLMESGRLTLIAESEGVDIRFDGEVIETGSQAGIYFYRLRFPPTIKYFQRRSSYRVKVLRTSAIPVTLVAKDTAVAKGELYNISSGGMAIKFQNPLSPSFVRGDMVPECELALPEGGKLVCVLEIRHIMSSRSEGPFIVGTRFVNLNTTQQRQINRFIATVERELRRKGT